MNFISAIGRAQLTELLNLEGSSVNISDPSIFDSVNNIPPFQHEINIKKINEHLFHVRINILPQKNYQPVSIDVPLTIDLNNAREVQNTKNSFHWLPNIKSSPNQIISQHVFRSPCIILTIKKKSFIFIPDIDALKNNTVAPYYMDLKYGEKKISIHYGLSNYSVVSHQYYEKNKKPFSLSSKLEIAFYVLIDSDSSRLAALKTANHFLWNHFAKEYTGTYLPQSVPFDKYASTGYDMALQHYWVNAGENKGGITLSTFYDSVNKIYRGRDSKDDLWYQSWFNNMRTAYGLFAWGKRLHREDWQQKALACVNLLLTSPDNKGWFSTIYDREKNEWISSGQGGGPNVYHVPDNAWTAYWLLRFNDELQKVEGADSMILDLAKAILKVQNPDGSFPTRINMETLQADSVLNATASSAMSTWILEELVLRNKINDSLKEKFQNAILRSLNFLSTKVIPLQKFEDFESYFSCSPKPMHYYDSNTAMYSQNTLSIQWCAEAYLKAYSLFKDVSYLNHGEYCLNILSLYQQIWNPPFIHFYAFGGFGAQNSDAEWSDARQAQFAETYLNYYLVTKNNEYLERAVYACRASFALMVLPENKNICPDNYAGTEINGEFYACNMSENYGHSGYDKRSNQSGFHWGTGSALTTAAIVKNKLGDIYITGKLAIGIDGIVVTHTNRTKEKVDITTKRIDHAQKMIATTDSLFKKNIFIDQKMVLPVTNL